MAMGLVWLVAPFLPAANLLFPVATVIGERCVRLNCPLAEVRPSCRFIDQTLTVCTMHRHLLGYCVCY
jgi:hypothetical protein